jgi:hypothetical protein
MINNKFFFVSAIYPAFITLILTLSDDDDDENDGTYRGGRGGA